MICDNCFAITSSDSYYGMQFEKIPRPFKKFCRFFGYKKHVDCISKNYYFSITWKKITSEDSELINTIKIQDETDLNNQYKNIEYLLKDYFIFNHIFIIPTQKYTFIEYNTKTKKIEKHIINKNKIIDVDLYLENTRYTDMMISYHDYEIIKEFEKSDKPIYQYFLPENISSFKHMYCKYGYYGNDNSTIYALSDEYLYYIRICF